MSPPNIGSHQDLTFNMNEETPLLSGSGNSTSNSRISFRRTIASNTSLAKINDGSPKGTDVRASVRVGGSLADLAHSRREVQPVDGLSPLVTGGEIITTDGYKTAPRPPSVVKSLPAFAPFRRKARHRSFYLWWINEFRHWWKSSRLLVRLAGLFTLAFTGLFLQKMLALAVYFPMPEMMHLSTKHLKHSQKAAAKHMIKRQNKQLLKSFHKAMRKTTRHAVKIVKHLGQGGPMKFFLNYVHPFTRSLRLLVAAWRWIEAAQCRRGEVGTEEAFAFMGNRVSRMLARLAVDSAVAYIIMPLAYDIFRFDFLQPDPEEWWHPLVFFITLGTIRAVAPFAASFQGSRVGRILTRSFFKAYKHRWLPIQPVQRLNLQSDDCCEQDEISQTADLAKMGKLVAKAFGRAKEIGLDGMEGQREVLEAEGFKQVGAGSGGYSVYECHRKVWCRDSSNSSQEVPEFMTLLLHVTPYGPSILNVMPRYIVLEFEDSVDRRVRWSEYISKKVFEGPPVVEGYCYGGAFFSPHHFAELKESYDKQLLAYDRACKALCKPRTGRKPNPPSDLRTLKEFLGDGKFGRQRRKNQNEMNELQSGVQKVARELKRMMASGGANCTAPRGVILYFEGLDCAGKSSTGGLVEQALRDSGFNVDMRQYNRPPTPEQKARPWMDRFEVPDTTFIAVTVNDGSGEDDYDKQELMKKCIDHKHSALVWDRGPAGDFVYNPEYRAMEMEDRKERYKDFMEFDRECFEKRILFLKLLFVTNRDSIAATLGKRLAQKHMAEDLRTWHKASRGADSLYGEMSFEGLDEISLHIDPTDFIAFNSYQTNLHIFTNFAMNTDSKENPWIVVNTGDRYNARKALLRAFKMKLQRFKDPCCCAPTPAPSDAEVTPTAITEDEMMDMGFEKAPPIRLILAFAGLLILLFYYCDHTSFGNPFRDTILRIEDLLPRDEDDGDLLYYNATNATFNETFVSYDD